jgi:hypothetical protein
MDDNDEFYNYFLKFFDELNLKDNPRLFDFSKTKKN